MPQKEKTFHIWTEFLSVFVAAPFMFWAGANHPDTAVGRVLLLFGASLVVVDGWLLSKAGEW